MKTLCKTLLYLVFLLILLSIQAPWKPFQGLPEQLRPFRPIPIAAANEIFRGWKIPSLSAEDLVYAATGATDIHALEEDGTDTFEKGLTILCKSFEDDSRLSFIGRIFTRTQFSEPLSVDDRSVSMNSFRASHRNKLRCSPPNSTGILLLGIPCFSISGI